MFGELVLRSIKGTKYWQVEEDFTSYTRYGKLVVPIGFKTDLATVPEILQLIVPASAFYLREPSVLHDYLYTKGCPYDIGKNRADSLLIEGMSYLGASSTQCWLVWKAVSEFGGRYYRV